MNFDFLLSAAPLCATWTGTPFIYGPEDQASDPDSKKNDSPMFVTPNPDKGIEEVLDLPVAEILSPPVQKETPTTFEDTAQTLKDHSLLDFAPQSEQDSPIAPAIERSSSSDGKETHPFMGGRNCRQFF